MAAKRKKAVKALEDLEKSVKKRGGRKKSDAAKGSKWARRLSEADPDDVRRILDRGVDETEEMANSAHSWLVRLAKRIRLMYDMLVAWWMGRFEFPKATVASIVLALLYFINPFDLVPDVLPVIGLVDEAMVFAFVASMMSDDVKRYTKKFGIKPAESGF